MPDVTEVFLGGVRDFITARLTELEYPPADAGRAASDVVMRIKNAWVSGLVYITKAHRYRHLLMARDIYRDFTGSNHSELCKKYGKSVPQIYNIVRQMRAEYVGYLQRDMFNDKEPDNSKVAEFVRLGLETLSQLMALCEQGLHSSLTISEENATDISESLADWAAREYGGQFIYIKAGSEPAPDDSQGDLFC